MKIEFGDKVKDTITGFSGVVTALAYYSTGCNQALIQPELGKDGEWQDARWFDFERVQVTEPKAITIKSTPTGGPRGKEAAPVR